MRTMKPYNVCVAWSDRNGIFRDNLETTVIAESYRAAVLIALDWLDYLATIYHGTFDALGVNSLNDDSDVFATDHVSGRLVYQSLA